MARPVGRAISRRRGTGGIWTKPQAGGMAPPLAFAMLCGDLMIRLTRLGSHRLLPKSCQNGSGGTSQRTRQPEPRKRRAFEAGERTDVIAGECEDEHSGPVLRAVGGDEV